MFLPLFHQGTTVDLAADQVFHHLPSVEFQTGIYCLLSSRCQVFSFDSKYSHISAQIFAMEFSVSSHNEILGYPNKEVVSSLRSDRRNSVHPDGPILSNSQSLNLEFSSINGSKNDGGKAPSPASVSSPLSSCQRKNLQDNKINHRSGQERLRKSSKSSENHRRGSTECRASRSPSRADGSRTDRMIIRPPARANETQRSRHTPVPSHIVRGTPSSTGSVSSSESFQSASSRISDQSMQSYHSQKSHRSQNHQQRQQQQQQQHLYVSSASKDAGQYRQSNLDTVNSRYSCFTVLEINRHNLCYYVAYFTNAVSFAARRSEISSRPVQRHSLSAPRQVLVISFYRHKPVHPRPLPLRLSPRRA